MQDIIKLENDQELKLDNNLGWLIEYQNQFGEDIIPTLMPLVMSMADLVGELAEGDYNMEDLTAGEILKILKSETALNAAIKLATFKSTDLINIIWALAKTADDSIEPPQKWIRQFQDGFPFDIILPKAATLVARGVMSSKNFERLTANWKKLQPKKKTKTTKKSK